MQRYSLPRLTAAVLPAVLALPLLAHIYVGGFTRLMADDYCFADVALEKGLWGALDYWYSSWTGTPSSTVGQSIVALLGPRANALLPGILLALWAAALIWAFYQMARLLNVPQPRLLAFLSGSLTLYGVVAGIPNVYQALYWTSGAVVYTGASMLATFHAGLILYTICRSLSGVALASAISLMLAFVIGGFTQTVAIMQPTLLVLALLACWRFLPDKRAGRAVLLAGLVGSALALIVTVAAPGNAVRQAAHPVSQSLFQVGLLTVQNTAAFVAMSLAYFSLIPALVCLILAALAAYHLLPLELAQRVRALKPLRLMGGAALVGFILIMAFLAPAAYGMGKMPASRAWVVPQFILMLVIVFWGVVIGLSLRKTASPRWTWRTGTLVGALLLAGPVLNTAHILSNASALSQYAAEWDALDWHLRAARGEDVAVRAYRVDMADYAKLDAIEDDSGFAYADCMREYYDLRSLSITTG